jgi:fatty acid desaturase
LLAINVLFLFTKSSGEMTRNKKIRNIIYYICGGGMILSLVGLFVFSGWAVTWWVEAIALMFFGIAYLTKADIYPWLFCDSKMEDKETDNT